MKNGNVLFYQYIVYQNSFYTAFSQLVNNLFLNYTSSPNIHGHVPLRFKYQS